MGHRVVNPLREIVMNESMREIASLSKASPVVVDCLTTIAKTKNDFDDQSRVKSES